MTSMLRDVAAGQTSSGGDVTLMFSVVPTGSVYSGSFSVPTSNAGAEWSAYINSASGVPIASWLGKTVMGPLSLVAGEKLVIVGSDVTASSNQKGSFVGRVDTDVENPFLFPDPLASSISFDQVVSGSVIVGPEGNRILIAPAGANPETGPDTRIQFDEGTDFMGYIYASGTIGKALRIAPPADTGWSVPLILLNADNPESTIELTADNIIGTLPAGSILATGRTTAPSGFLFCDGSSVLRTDYPDLFDAIGTTYGSVDATHFTLPNLNAGRFPMGKATAGTGSTLGGTGGSKDSVVVSHTHTTESAHSGALSGGRLSDANSGGAGTSGFAFLATSTAGVSGTDQNLPPYQVVNWMIAT